MDLNHRPMPYQSLISKEERVIMVLLAGFEPAKHNVVDYRSTAFDRSATVTYKYKT